ncbi:MAG: thioredoxin [Bacillota bacterium]|nr:thioredoxin [Bacillota bacterium]
MAKVINKVEFQDNVIKGEGVVLVDYFAQWCGPCKMIAPILDELSQELDGKVKIFKVDVDQSSELSREYNIMGVPTMLIFKNGKEVDKIVGFVPKSTLKAKLEYWNN